MRRIDTATAAANLFGAGKPGFKDGNLALGVAPTDLNAAWFNGVQEELLAIIEGAGLVPSAGALNQVLLALRVQGAVKGLSRYTANGTWVCPAGVTTVYVTGVGGGGGGGGSLSCNASGNITTGGGGGGAGQSAIRQPFATTPGAAYAVFIGAGGASGIAYTGGGVGGPTAANGLLLLNGGGGGLPGVGGGSNGTFGGPPGGPGWPAGGWASDLINIFGGAGGVGASSPFGGGGPGCRGGANIAGEGGAAAGFGAGGGGGGGGYIGTGTWPASAGGLGSPGFLIFEW